MLLHTLVLSPHRGSSLGAEAQREASGEECADGRHDFAGLLRFGGWVVVCCQCTELDLFAATQGLSVFTREQKHVFIQPRSIVRPFSTWRRTRPTSLNN